MWAVTITSLIFILATGVIGVSFVDVNASNWYLWWGLALIIVSILLASLLVGYLTNQFLITLGLTKSALLKYANDVDIQRVVWDIKHTYSVEIVLSWSALLLALVLVPTVATPSVQIGSILLICIFFPLACYQFWRLHVDKKRVGIYLAKADL
jgi:uncharacterized membrane protein (DUF441 family)